MSGSHIGIKIADGSFYPILDKTAKTKKRLTLTTAHDNQRAVQIALYQGTQAADESSEAEYVGTLVVENIESAPRGESDVSLVIGIDDGGNLNATATDVNSGEYQSLSISLASIEDQNMYAAPNFSLEEREGEQFAVDYEDDEDAQQDRAQSEPLSLDELDDEFSLETGEEQDHAWEEALDLDEESFTVGAAESEETAETAEPAAGPEAESEDADFDFELELDEDEPDFNFDVDSDEPRLESGAAVDESAAETDPADAPGEIGLEDEDFGDHDFGDDIEDDGVAHDEPERRTRMGFTADLESQREQRGPGVVMFLGFVLLALAALGFLTYIIFRAIESPDIPPLEAGWPLLPLLPLPFRTRSGRGRGVYRRRL